MRNLLILLGSRVTPAWGARLPEATRAELLRQSPNRSFP